MRVTNAFGLALIKKYEQGSQGGPGLVAYRDPAGVWTIGYGHTGGVYKGDMITAAEADYLLAQDLMAAEEWVNARTDPTQTSDNQFAAMVSLTFNIGERGFLGSSVRSFHNQQMFFRAGASFLLWDKAHINGSLVVVSGLVNRRAEERSLYLAGLT